jgi:ectoine hydroxylase-related dioxygenase (phytanoyl-CoA dioxygenase family)
LAAVATEPGSDLKPFRQLRATELDSAVLREHLVTHGYVLIRNLLLPNDLNRLRTEMTQIAVVAGWLRPGRDPLDRIANPAAACSNNDPAFKRVANKVFTLESFHALPHHPALRRMMELLVGPHLLVHPKPIPRLVFPNAETFRLITHQDHHAIAGDVQTFTAWMPLHDCPVKLGPLQILEGSHRFGLQTPPGNGVIPPLPPTGSHWVGGRIDVGDVLIFHSLTVHAASPNTSTQLRISLDCRFQSYDRPINPANLAFAGPGAKSWETTYANWRSEKLMYYWKQLPLQFKPSPAELAERAKAADPNQRTRYARILAQVMDLIPG